MKLESSYSSGYAFRALFFSKLQSEIALEYGQPLWSHGCRHIVFTRQLCQFSSHSSPFSISRLPFPHSSVSVPYQSISVIRSVLLFSFHYMQFYILPFHISKCQLLRIPAFHCYYSFIFLLMLTTLSLVVQLHYFQIIVFLLDNWEEISIMTSNVVGKDSVRNKSGCFDALDASQWFLDKFSTLLSAIYPWKNS